MFAYLNCFNTFVGLKESNAIIHLVHSKYDTDLGGLTKIYEKIKLVIIKCLYAIFSLGKMVSRSKIFDFGTVYV